MRKLPPRISPERLLEIVPLLKSGDRSFEKEIIEGHLRLGIKIAKRHHHYPDCEELEAVAELAITETVHRSSRKGVLIDNNITGLIIANIKLKIKEFISEDRLFGVPARTVRYWNQTNDERVRRLPFKLAIVRDSHNIKVDASGECVELKIKTPYVVPETPDVTSEVDIREIINKLPTNQIEKKILELREQGYTIIEIGQIIGYSKSRIGELLTFLEEKFDKLYKEVK